MKFKQMKGRNCIVAAVIAVALTMNGCTAPGNRPDGYLSTGENIAKIQAGKTTGKEVEQLLGAPLRVVPDGRRGWDYWEYRVYEWPRRKLWIGISGDGVVRDVVQLIERERPGTS